MRLEKQIMMIMVVVVVVVIMEVTIKSETQHSHRQFGWSLLVALLYRALWGD